MSNSKRLKVLVLSGVTLILTFPIAVFSIIPVQLNSAVENSAFQSFSVRDFISKIRFQWWLIVSVLILIGIVAVIKVYHILFKSGIGSRIKKELEENKRSIRKILEFAPIGMAIARDDGHIVYANDALCNLLGYSKQALESLSVKNTTHPEDHELTSVYMKNLINGTLSGISVDKRYLKKDGEVVWGHLTVSIHEDARKKKFFIAQIENITERKIAEEKLIESENKFHVLFESAADLILILDMDGLILDINNMGHTRLGYNKEEMLGKLISSFDAPAFAERVPERMAQLANEGIARFESAHLRKDGTVMPIEVNARIVELGGNKRVLSVIRDITHRQQMENVLSKRETKYLAAIETSSDGFWIVDLEGHLLEVNDAYLRRSGYSREEILSMHVSDLEAKENSEETSTHIKNIIQYRQDRFETYHRTKDGTIWPVEIVTNYWSIDGGRLFVFIVDITERKKTLEQINLMAKVFQNSVEAMIITDSNNHIININPSFTILTGYTRDEVLGKDPKVLSTGRESREFYKEMWRRIINEGSWQGGISGKRKDGSVFPKWLTIATLCNDRNEIINYIAGFIDITGRKQIESDLEQQVKERTEDLNRTNASLVFANRAKDSFLATMSHEIRTPLSGMLGMLELLNLSQLEDGQRDTLQTARDSGKSLLRILNDILEWSKIEEGKLSLVPQPTSHIQLLEEVVSTYSQVARSAGLILRQHADPRLSAMHIVDPLRISEILNNFVSNALKFTTEGEVEVWDELLEKKDGMERIRFSVRDTGIGIEKHLQQQVFQVYMQANNQTERMYGGTGLGLAICRRLADLMGGEITLESSPGNGSTFSIALWQPVVLSDPEQTMNNYEVAVLSQPIFKNLASIPKVLVVDDNPVNAALLVRQVEVLGLIAESAEDGKIGLNLWREGQFAMVITDCHMPIMNGYELSTAIRKIESEQNRSRMPIIASTANALSQENELCHLAGMDEVIIKPVNLVRLRSVLMNWLPEVREVTEYAPVSM